MRASDGQTFRKLAVIGAGNMGSGIAQKMATEGFRTVLVDLDDEKVARGIGILERTLAQGVERKLFRPEQAQEIRARVHGTTRFGELGDADLVVEAVFEDPAVKREVFERLEATCRPDTVLATNTSSLRVSDLAAGLAHPERFVGLHYFYHPAKNRLVEVVAGQRTDPDVWRAAWALQEQLGKTPIASADSPGFVVNRYFVPWLNEATRLLEEGLADIPTIDAACKDAFGTGMGPFELMNVTGVPIALHAATTLGQGLGRLYAPSARLRAQVASGQNWPLEGQPDTGRFAAVTARMLGTVFHVAAALVEEGVGTIEDTDIGARVGLRWPHGPFEMMNRLGVASAADLSSAVAARFDLTPPRLLAEQAATARPFALAVVRSDVRDGVATLTVNRPDAMNALDETVVAQLHAGVRDAVANPEVRGIVITGAGKAFIAGADIRFFVRHMEAGDLDRIVAFTRAGHELLAAIDSSPKPVVARVQGLALGGGLELALACDAIVASTKASLAFPETGIGIYPGLGGTQRATRRLGKGLAKWLIYTGQTLGAEQAAAIGLVDRSVPHERLDEAVREALRPGPRRARPALAPDAAALERFFAGHTVETIRAGRAETGGSAELAAATRRVGTKAPIALRLAERLIDEGSELDLGQALALELDHLREIFGTADAYEGLTSLGQRRPAFQGR